MEWHSTYKYSSNAPCAMCHQHAPSAQTKVSLSARINSTYSRVVEYSVPVCDECKKLYERPYIFGFKRMILEAKVRKWLRNYLVRSGQVQSKRSRSEQRSHPTRSASNGSRSRGNGCIVVGLVLMLLFVAGLFGNPPSISSYIAVGSLLLLLPASLLIWSGMGARKQVSVDRGSPAQEQLAPPTSSNPKSRQLPGLARQPSNGQVN